jgi:hypothetical protein
LADHALEQVQRYTWQTLGVQLLRGYESRCVNL